MPDKVKAAIYIRVARTDDIAIEQQKKQLRIFAQKQGYNDIAIYSDNGYNGLNLNRPAFIQMESDIQAGLINTVVIRDTSRISRNYLHIGKWLDDMRSRNIRVISANDNFDSSNYNAVDASFAEAIEKYYKESHSQKIKAGIAHSRQRKLGQAAKL